MRGGAEEGLCDGGLSTAPRRSQARIDSSRYATVGSVWSHGEILHAAAPSSDPDPPGEVFHLLSLSLSLLFRTKAPLALRYAPSFHSFVHPILACCPIRTKHKAKV